MPKLAKVLDKATLIRSCSYTPAGLFNHTAAIYQMMTGYTPDKVSPSGQLDPPIAKRLSVHRRGDRADPSAGPIRCCRSSCCPGRCRNRTSIGKGGTAGFLGARLRPVLPVPGSQRPALNTQDLVAAAGDQSGAGWNAGRRCCRRLTRQMPDIEKAVSEYALDAYDQKALELVISGRARKAFDLNEENDATARQVRPAHVRPIAAAGPPADRSRDRASCR